jgi:hypothetical protein
VVGSACCAGAGDGCADWTGASVVGCAGRSTVFFGFGRTVWVRLGAGEEVAEVGLAEREGLLLTSTAASLAPGELVVAVIATTTITATAIMAATPHTADRRRPVQRRVGPSSPVTHET